MYKTARILRGNESFGNTVHSGTFAVKHGTLFIKILRMENKFLRGYR